MTLTQSRSGRKPKSEEGEVVATPVSLVALDAGNYALKVVENGQERQLRSIQHQLSNGSRALKAGQDSPIVELESGETWHVGKSASNYQGVLPTALLDKATLARLHFYAATTAVEGDVELIFSHHSTEQVEMALKSQLIGQHKFKRNGFPCQLNVKALNILPEGEGSFWLAKEQGFVLDGTLTIVIDIGGRTWLYRVFDSDGEVVKEEVKDGLGSFGLATRLASDRRLIRDLQSAGINSPDVSKILEGFANGHTYGVTGVTWSDYFTKDYLDPWRKEIMGTVIQSTQSYRLQGSVGRYVLTGGGATLLQDKLGENKYFVALPDPAFANVRGMYNLLKQIR